MIELFNTPINSPIIIALTILYFICESIATFVIRIEQAKRNGSITPDEAILPTGVGLFIILGWVIFIVLILLNWKYAIIVFVIKFVLKVLPVLETIGNILMAPFKPQRK